ncbi:outer membrane protein [Bartonella sp. ML69XJBT]|uniref:outer membrane protein n=1 Tax=Bartonella sp. ML69XJBT TaxID=3019092 RepID=UPI00235E9AB4|nr:outer membrane protein [Bartonella sp. ML69XJBT]
MNTKRLITTSIFALISASTVQAADVVIPHQPTPVTSSSFVAPTFTWEGFYFGGEGGGFSSKTDMSIVGKHKTVPLSKDLSPKLSGFEGGLYAGSNIDLGDNFILSIDTDFIWSGQKHTKTITIGAPGNSAVDNLLSRARKSTESVSSATKTDSLVPAFSEGMPKQESAKVQRVEQNGTLQPAIPGQPESKSLQGSGVVLVSAPGTAVTLSGVNSTKASSARGSGTLELGRSEANSTGSRSSGATNSLGSSTSATAPATGVSSSGGAGPLRSSISAPPSATGARSSGGAGSSGSSTSAAIRTTRVNTLGTSVGASASGLGSTGVGRSGASLTGSSRSTGVSVLRSASTEEGSARVVEALSATPKSTEAPAAPKPPAAPETAAPKPPAAPETAAPKPLAAPETAAVSNLRETTVPKKPLLLARSGSSRSEVNAANGGGNHAQGHGTGTNPHGSSARQHAGGNNPHSPNPHGVQSTAGRSVQGAQEEQNASNMYGIEQIKEIVSELGLEDNGAVGTLSHTLKQNWAGATRVRIGFAADRFMPYVAGGVAYTQLQDTVSVSFKRDDGTVVASKNLTDETKTMVGYTIGGGVDFAMLDNVILRAEYRYSDFGKKKFAKEKFEIKYTTNDFRVGVAYKF